MGFLIKRLQTVGDAGGLEPTTTADFAAEMSRPGTSVSWAVSAPTAVLIGPDGSPGCESALRASPTR